MTKTLTDKEFWDEQFWKSGQAVKARNRLINYRYFADQLLEEYIPYNPEASFLEIGCVPGKNMVYFAKKFGCKVSGVDYSEAIHQMPATLEAQGIVDFELFHCDFLDFTPPKKYDIVFSAGFVEHFSETELIFKKHCDVLNPGGFLIISLPNFQYGQKFLRILSGARQIFEWHNLEVMYPKIWGKLAEKQELSVFYSDYYGTFKFWFPSTYHRYLQLLASGTSYVIERGLRIVHLDKIPNRFLSPHILLLAQKP